MSDLETTRDSRAEALKGMRDEMLKIAVRYQSECALTTEEIVGALAITRWILLRDHFSGVDDGE